MKIFGHPGHVYHYCKGRTILSDIQCQNTLALYWAYRQINSILQIAAALGCIDTPISFTNQIFRATAGFNARLVAVLAAFRIHASSGTSSCARLVQQITGTLNFYKINGHCRQIKSDPFAPITTTVAFISKVFFQSKWQNLATHDKVASLISNCPLAVRRNDRFWQNSPSCHIPHLRLGVFRTHHKCSLHDTLWNPSHSDKDQRLLSDKDDKQTYYFSSHSQPCRVFFSRQYTMSRQVIQNHTGNTSLQTIPTCFIHQWTAQFHSHIICI